LVLELPEKISSESSLPSVSKTLVGERFIVVGERFIVVGERFIVVGERFIVVRERFIVVRERFIGPLPLPLGFITGGAFFVFAMCGP
jgi:hypothetical protein